MEKSLKKEIESYTDKIKNPKIRIIIIKIRKIINDSFPGVEEKISWGALCYRKSKYICALHIAKDYVRLDFFVGIKLNDPNKLLHGSGNKLRHIKIKSIDGINTNKKQLISWIKGSMEIDKK